MSFCTNCGKELEENAVCSCQTAGHTESAQESATVNAVPVTTGYSTPNGKLYSILSYVGILWLIGMLAAPEKDDALVRFHVNQGLVLTIASVVLTAAINLVGIILPDILTGLLSFSVSVASLVFMILGIIAANNGEEKELPIIGQFKIYK